METLNLEENLKVCPVNITLQWQLCFFDYQQTELDFGVLNNNNKVFIGQLWAAVYTLTGKVEQPGLLKDKSQDSSSTLGCKKK